MMSRYSSCVRQYVCTVQCTQHAENTQEIKYLQGRKKREIEKKNTELL